MKNQQTDNTYLKHKIVLRQHFLNKNNQYKILNCYAGDNKIYNNISKKYNIQVVNIDIKNKKNSLKGDNKKYLLSMNLSKFNIIDLDSYGIPFNQLEILYKKKYKGIVVITFIQSMFGNIHKKMLYQLGYTREMIKKCPTLFNKNDFEKFKNYLNKFKIKSIIYYNINNKYYAYIKLNAV